MFFPRASVDVVCLRDFNAFLLQICTCFLFSFSPLLLYSFSAKLVVKFYVCTSFSISLFFFLLLLELINKKRCESHHRVCPVNEREVQLFEVYLTKGLVLLLKI